MAPSKPWQQCDSCRKFGRWIASSRLPYREVARLLGVNLQMVGHLRSGIRRPSLLTAVKIEMLTADFEEGPIRPKDWFAGVTPYPVTIAKAVAEAVEAMDEANAEHEASAPATELPASARSPQR